jgi:Carbohydrate binding domain/PEP-CTERM motif
MNLAKKIHQKPEGLMQTTKIYHNFMATICAVVLLSAAAAQAGVNLVVNGGFESPVIAPPYQVDVQPTGWTGIGDLTVQGYAGSVNSGDGNQWFDLNPDTSAGNGISQVISLTTGDSYTFSFIYNGGGGGTTTEINYSIGADVIGSVSTAALNVYGGSSWAAFSTTFTASGASETLGFLPNGVYSGGFIDQVQITANAVPEPSICSLLGVGLAGVWQFCRRRKEKSS